MQIVNTAILKSPLNWLTVFLMLLLAALGGHLLLTLLGIEPTRRDDVAQSQATE